MPEQHDNPVSAEQRVTDELLPCPFCGGEADYLLDEENEFQFSAICKSCHAGTDSFYETASAGRAWNRRAALTAAPASAGVEVKKLEWNGGRAETPFGYYNIDDQTDRTALELNGRLPFLLSGSRLVMSRHESLAEAKAAAQADYEQRILSALSPVGVSAAGEPFAWTWEDEDGCLFITRDSRKDDIVPPDAKPLYRVPPSAGEREKALEEALRKADEELAAAGYRSTQWPRPQISAALSRSEPENGGRDGE